MRGFVKLPKLKRNIAWMNSPPLTEQLAIDTRREFANPRLADIRMSPVPDFSRYLIFYQHSDDEIRVLRVLHSSRDIASLFSSED